MAVLVAQMVKNLPPMQETWVRFPRLGRTPGEGNGNLLQYSCLEKSTDRGTWGATVHGVAESDITEQLTLSLSSVVDRSLKWSPKIPCPPVSGTCESGVLYGRVNL